jgi:hypothetical protein
MVNVPTQNVVPSTSNPRPYTAKRLEKNLFTRDLNTETIVQF